MKDIYHLDDVSVVVDNNVLIDLYELDCINILFEVFNNVIIPKIIYDDEMQTEIKNKLHQYRYILRNIGTELGLQTYQELVNNVNFKRLSRHDRFAIAIAKENFYYCNSNDKPVRKACELLGVKYTGVLGVLGRAYFKKIITESKLKKYLDLLISSETSSYIDIKTINEFKDEIDLD